MCTLYPPHYDAVTSFGLYKDLLFSSCGVTIKQWDIKEHCLKHVMQNYSKILLNTFVLCPNTNKDKDEVVSHDFHRIHYCITIIILLPENLMGN